MQATQDKKELEQETLIIKKDIADIEVVIQKLDQEKTNRDHTIKTLNDEIANQDEIINKLNKVSKYILALQITLMCTAGEKACPRERQQVL